MIQNLNKGNHFDIFILLTQKELKLRYKSKYFGYLWSILNPLLFTLVYYFIFSVIMKVRIENYPAFLVCGLFPWQWISNSISTSPMIYLGNASIVKKLNFPRNILPFVVVTQDGFHFLMTIPVIIITLFIFDIYPSVHLLWGIPFLTILQFILVYSIGLILASVNLFFRDTENIIKFLLMFTMYLTPIMYSETMIPERFQKLVVLNPFALLIINWRNLFMSGVISLEYAGILVIYCILFWVIAKNIYNRLSYKFAEVL